MRMQILAIATLGLLSGCTGAGDGGDGPGAACPPDMEFFEKHLWQPTLSSKCINCHNPTGLASSSRFVLRMVDDDAAMVENLEVTVRVAALTENGQSILLLRPTGQHPDGHPGGTLFLPGSTEYESFASFVARVRGEPDACASGPGRLCDADDPFPGRRRLRRLARAEYDATIADLFGIPSAYGEAFVSDVVVNGFDNDAAALTVSPLLAAQLAQAAEDIAAQVAAPAHLPTFAPCADPGTTASARACAETFARVQGARVYRRPLLDDEIERLLAVHDVGAAGGYAAGIELMLTAMLQSPSFLYRSELGTLGDDGRYALDAYELASELSYFLWGSMPDEELMAAARSGALTDPDELERQARRLLASPRSHEVVGRFARRWLDLTQLGTVVKDDQLFAGFTPAVRDAMADEAASFVAGLTLSSGGTFTDLLTAPLPAPPGVLADFYGAPAGAPARAGVLELGGVLAAHARPNSTSPIHRGKLVREQLLCQPLPPPPAGLNAQPPGLDPTLTTRERYGAHSQDEACKGCHQLMDPIGFGFEHFDGVGRWRAEENGFPIDDAGEILGVATGAGPFHGTGELAAQLAASPEAQTCFARQWVRFGWGTGDSADTQCAQTAIEAAFVAGNGRVDELMVALVRSPHFRFREERADGAGGGEADAEADAGVDEPPPPGSDASVPGTPDAGAVAELVVTSAITSDWGAGYCARVTVSNVSDHPVTWSVDLQVEGTINNHWGAVMTSLEDGRVRFTGESHSATVAAGDIVELGYCALR